MSITRVECEECGLAATHIEMGDRIATSFDAEECATRCAIGRAARAVGDPVAARVLECRHLDAALRLAVSNAKRRVS